MVVKFLLNFIMIDVCFLIYIFYFLVIIMKPSQKKFSLFLFIYKDYVKVGFSENIRLLRCLRRPDYLFNEQAK